MNKTSYHSKIVGVTFEGRQEVISSLNGDEPLRFRREPENEYDPNAVAVDAFVEEELYPNQSSWKPIGYIAKDKNAELASILDKGKEASIKISEITGGEDKNYGVNVYIEYETERKPVRSLTAELVTDIFGNEIFYDPVSHEYTNSLGEIYMSGSRFGEKSEKPFDAQMISEKMALKHSLEPEDVQNIQDMWKLKAEASASLGTAIHAALELYGKYKPLAERIDKETHFHDNPILKKAVQAFYMDVPDADKPAQFECLVVDHKAKRAGRIDRLEYDMDGVWVTDFKTNFDVSKSLKKYWLQLSFYAAIIRANGRVVKGLKIYHYNGEEWKTILGEVIDIDKEIL